MCCADPLLWRRTPPLPGLHLILLLEEDLRAAGGNMSLEQWAELEDLLRKSMIELPHLAAPRLALAACLRQEARYLEAQTAPARVAVPGLRVEAENLLREAVAEEPCRSAPRLAVAEFLLENLRYGEAETVAAAAVQRCPTSAELRLVLARIQLQLLRLDDAEKTIEALLAIAPENAWAWFEYGKILQNSHHRSDSAFERAADLSGNDSGLLAGVAQHFLYDLDYEKAAKYYERLLNLHPGMWDNFVICRHYATCLQKIARAQEAAQIIANALESCRRAAERAKSEGLELIKREEALLLLQAGRADESFATLQSIQGIAAGSTLRSGRISAPNAGAAAAFGANRSRAGRFRVVAGAIVRNVRGASAGICRLRIRHCHAQFFPADRTGTATHQSLCGHIAFHSARVHSLLASRTYGISRPLVSKPSRGEPLCALRAIRVRGERKGIRRSAR